MKKILIIEDDTDINNMIKKYLTENEYLVEQAFSGTEGKLLFSKDSFECLLIDLMLPGLSGEELIKTIRETKIVPIIVMSAKIDIQDKVNALNIGADDYITKPINFEELVARIEAQIRRFNFKEDEEKKHLTYKNCSINTDLMSVKVNNNIIDFTAMEYRILVLFMKNPKRVFTRNDIYELCWKDEFIGDDNTLDVHISHIRSKISKFDKEDYIKTIRGIGYRLD